jgi:DNA-directed RNA polymerase subunit M/transcription elongation factor TFIIS
VIEIFCPNCDSVLVPIKNEEKSTDTKILGCLDCDYQSNDNDQLENYVIKDQVHHSSRSKIEVIDQEIIDSGISPEVREELREQYREALGNARS